MSLPRYRLCSFNERCLLQCVTVCCRVLQCVVVYKWALSVAACCSVLRCCWLRRTSAIRLLPRHSASSIKPLPRLAYRVSGWRLSRELRVENRTKIFRSKSYVTQINPACHTSECLMRVVKRACILPILVRKLAVGGIPATAIPKHLLGLHGIIFVNLILSRHKLSCVSA